MAKRSRQKTAQPERVPRPGTKLDTLETAPFFLPVLAACGLVMGILLFDANLGLSGDNAQFINIGRSLAAGLGLVETFGDDPVPHTKYPFGFPLLIAIVHLVFPDSVFALKSMVVLLYALCIPLAYRLVRLYADPPVSLSVALLCLISPPLLDFSHQVMSEIPFVPVALLALIFLERAHRVPTYSHLVYAILAMMAAYYIRSAGLALVGAGVLFFLLHKQWKEAAMIAGGCLLLALPWYVRNAALGGGDYTGQLLSIDPYRPHLGTLTLVTLVERLAANLEIYGLREIPRVFVPAVEHVLIALPFSVLVLYGIISGMRRRELPAVYLVAYLGLYLLWPQVWSDIRFLIPAIPVLFYVVLSSVMDLAGRIRLSPYTALAAFFFLFAVANVQATHDLSTRIGTLPPNWKNYFDAGEWIRDHTDPGVRVACRKPDLMYLIANRKTMGYIWDDPDAVIRDFEEKGVDIAIIDQIGFSSTPQYLVPAVQQHWERFEVLHIVPNPDTYVLSFK